jgi:hypothetical protein
MNTFRIFPLQRSAPQRVHLVEPFRQSFSNSGAGSLVAVDSFDPFRCSHQLMLSTLRLFLWRSDDQLALECELEQIFLSFDLNHFILAV